MKRHCVENDEACLGRLPTTQYVCCFRSPSSSRPRPAFLAASYLKRMSRFKEFNPLPSLFRGHSAMASIAISMFAAAFRLRVTNQHHLLEREPNRVQRHVFVRHSLWLPQQIHDTNLAHAIVHIGFALPVFTLHDFGCPS